MKDMFKLTKLDKFKLAALIVKAITGVAGGSLVLTEGHPYITLTVLGLGAGANEFIMFLEKRVNNNGEV